MRTMVLAVCLAVAGCAASGVKVTDNQLGALVKGRTTVADAVQSFGPPTTRAVAADGQVTLIYTYAEATVRGATFIPIVGLFAGGTDVKANSATLRFGADGKLLDYSTAETQQGVGMGFSSGVAQPIDVSQPRK